jgi:3-isopropylmalate/(R)-2-methylmalate dehydratase small subunit
MQAMVSLHSCMLPLSNSNVDTDQIIPANFLKVISKEGLADGLFESWRYLPDGKPNPDFPLNKPAAVNRTILIAGDNFGCGSSREHAPWALLGWGFRAIISTSFADIFRNNALKNGLLPVEVDAEFHRQLFDLATASMDVTGSDLARFAVDIDVASQTVRLPDGRLASFPLDAFSKTCLLQGVDTLGYLFRHESNIRKYEERIQMETTL